MGSCLTTEQMSPKSTKEITPRPSQYLTVVPGDVENIGYLMHDVIVKNNIPQCAYLLQTGFPIDAPLKYSASVPLIGNSENRIFYYEFYGTALHVACIYRRPAMVELLMLHNANPNVTDRFGRTPVILAVTYWPRIALMNADNKGVCEIIMKTIPVKSYRCLESLCLNGADVNRPYGIHMETPLHLSARYHIAQCAKLLLEFGADVNARDIRGMTPLHYACQRVTQRKDDQQLVGLLLKFGANVNAKDQDGNTPLHVAATTSCANFVCYLIAFGADPELTNNSGLSAVYLLLNCVHSAINVRALNIILNESTYLRIFNHQHELPKLLRSPDFEGVSAVLIVLATTPPSLKLICRQFIRKAIGVRNLSRHSTGLLPLPSTLQNLLLTQPYFVPDLIA